MPSMPPQDEDLANAEEHFKALDIGCTGYLPRSQVEALGEWAWKHFHPTGAPLTQVERTQLGSKLMKGRDKLSLRDFFAWYIHVRSQVASRKARSGQQGGSSGSGQVTARSTVSPRNTSTLMGGVDEGGDKTFRGAESVGGGSPAKVVEELRAALESEKRLLESREQEIKALRETTDILAKKVQEQDDNIDRDKLIETLKSQLESDGSRSARIVQRLQAENETLEDKAAAAEAKLAEVQVEAARLESKIHSKEEKLQEVIKEARTYQDEMNSALREKLSIPEKIREMQRQVEEARTVAQVSQDRLAASQKEVASLKDEMSSMAIALQAQAKKAEEGAAAKAVLDETTEKMRKAIVLRDETEKELAKTRDVVASLKAEITTKSSAFDPRDVELDSLHAEAAELRTDLQRSRDEMSRMNAEVASLRHLKAAAASSPSPGGGGAATRAEVDELRARVSVLRESVVHSERDCEELRAQLASVNGSSAGPSGASPPKLDALERRLVAVEGKLHHEQAKVVSLERENLLLQAQLDVASSTAEKMTRASDNSKDNQASASKVSVLEMKLRNLLEASEQDRIESEQALSEKDSVIASLRQQLTNADVRGGGGVIKSYA